MTWKINWSDEARKQLRKLDKPLQKKIIKYMRDRISASENPTSFGKPLKHDKFGLWRYRVEQVRIICQIRDGEAVVLILRVGHRKEIYND